jgi:anthraniloyl-CoA monooxygenase
MDEADLRRVRDDFANAACSAEQAGFDALLLHGARGYLLASFLSPLSNRRADQYGGSLENRMRYPLEVLDAVRSAWPENKPLIAAIPASDFSRGGWSEEDAVAFAQSLKDRGCDAVAVLTGQASYESEPTYGKGFLNTISDLVRNQVRIPVISGGYICTADLANTAVAAGRADLCIIERVS